MHSHKTMTATITAMTRSQQKCDGKNLTIYYSFFESRFGKTLVASTNRGICAILFCNTNITGLADLRSRWPKAVYIAKSTPAHTAVKNYFYKPKPNSKIQCHVKGTNFQIKVWKALLSILPKTRSTYRDVAAQIGHPQAVRAVGNAVGSNPICYIIPCHRVIRSNGNIGEYHWGAKRKRAILAYEETKRKPKSG